MARLCLLALLGLALVSPVHAQSLLQKLTPALIGNALGAAGVAYTTGTDRVGDPMLTITGGTPARGAQVIFFTCSGTTCEDATLMAYLRPAAGARLERINDWNRAARWTRAYIDQDGDAVIELDINATGGIGEEAVRILVRTFLDQVAKFAKHVDGGI